jgi:lysozyme
VRDIELAAIAAGLVAAGLLLLYRRQAAPELVEAGGAQPAAGLAFSLSNIIEEAGRLVTPAAPADTAAANLRAFLLVIRYAEGTAGPNGYRTLFGGRLFEGWADHPRVAQRFTDRAGRTLWTTAAGAYQLLAVSIIPGGASTKMDTWDRLKRQLALPDFSPASQDRAAVALLDEAGALDDVRAGRFEAAVVKSRRIWASLPGAGYDQPERTLADLARVYTTQGGTFA